MAQPAEFEEKEYEGPLNLELLLDARNPLWTPGQVFEEHFGIDAALHATNPAFWVMFGYPNIPDGVILNHFSWGCIWRKVRSPRRLPTFKTNLLLQTKRPHHRTGRSTYYASYGITGQYWQFEKTAHQQHALERLKSRLANRALICYACAAFHTLNDLYTHINNKTLVDNSTFVQVHRLTNHDKWVYDKPGSVGLACSEVEEIKDSNFRDLINGLVSNEAREDDPLQNLINLQNAIFGVVGELSDNPISPQFNRQRDLINSFVTLDDSRSSQAVIAFLNISQFCRLTNTSWFVVS